MLDILKWDEAMDVLIIDSQDNIIASGEEEKYRDALDYEQLTGGDYKKMTVLGSPCIVTLRAVSYTHLFGQCAFKLCEQAVAFSESRGCQLCQAAEQTHIHQINLKCRQVIVGS